MSLPVPGRSGKSEAPATSVRFSQRRLRGAILKENSAVSGQMLLSLCSCAKHK